VQAFIPRITTAPGVFDLDRGEEAVAKISAAGPLADLLRGAAGSSPFLASLIGKEADWLADAIQTPPEVAMTNLMANLATDERDAGIVLREAKRRAALLIGLADLGGVWALEEVTGALSDFADAATRRAFDVAIAGERNGPLAGMTAEEAGLVVLAMGKGGARELNYSSDIDLILLFEDERFDDLDEVRPRWTKVAQRAVKLLSEHTGAGYVFRTDLRLRPNPSVTSPCMPMSVAERYYESVGRTWERSAFIKARVVGGDMEAGRQFLDGMVPFIWRRHLDFAALEDINDIRAKIRDAKGLAGLRDLPGYNLKLGPGGIREIEFFAQTQQLALGGRDKTLRTQGTCDALSALANAGRISDEDAEALIADYTDHRRLEHRFQMVEDAQTHDMPVADDARDQVALLGGWPDRITMEAEVADRLADVRARVTRFSKPHETETEDEPDLELDKLGFERPEMIAEMADRWALGGIAATRDQRARRKFKALTPIILQKLSSSSEPDEAALQFDRFMSGLPTGVQLFSLFEANPQLLDLLVEICAVAPKLAEHLARNSAVLDAVLDADFFAPMPVSAEMTADLCLAINDDGDDFEAALNTARRWAKEMKFRLGVQVLRGVADGCEAGRGFSAIAEACLIALKPVVEADFARRHGPPPGRGAAVIAMGKLGSREMTASSDLDLIVIYDAAGETESTGVKPLTMQVYFARLTQKLVSALTAPTSEGMLYEVDMRLRPSGGQGPVAIGLAGFQNYQMNEAWTWEHMALTRARVIAGEETLATELTDTIASVLAAPRDAEKTRADVAEMRGRLEAAHGAARDRLWALKQARGGLMDVEFAAQCGLLSKSVTGARSPETSLPLLVEKGAISADDASALIAAYSLQSHLQHVERIAHAGAFQADEAGEGLKAALARIGEANDFDELDVKLGNLRTVAADVVDRVLGEA